MYQLQTLKPTVSQLLQILFLSFVSLDDLDTLALQVTRAVWFVPDTNL